MRACGCGDFAGLRPALAAVSVLRACLLIGAVAASCRFPQTVYPPYSVLPSRIAAGAPQHSVSTVCCCSVSEFWNSVALSCGPSRHRGAQKAIPSQANAAPQPCSRARGSYCAGCCCPRLPHPAACMLPAEQWRQVPMQQRAFSRGAARCCDASTFPARARCPSCPRIPPGRQVNTSVGPCCHPECTQAAPTHGADSQLQALARLSWNAAGVVSSGAALEQHLKDSQLGCHRVLHWVAASRASTKKQ